MNTIDENIKEIVRKVVEINDFLLIDIILRGTEHNRVIEVFIDGEKDISADDCAIVSRKIESELNALLAKHPNYRLDVSSPGIDRPLKFLRQYAKHINRKFEVSYRSGEEFKKLSGKFTAIEGDLLTFISDNKEVIINFNHIINANVLVSVS
jgi:ribosome maturation factor RimP